MQAVALGPAILLAPLLLAIFEPRGLRSTISRFRWLYGLVVGLTLAVLVGGLVLGHTPQDLLGAYSPVGDRSYDVGEALRYLWWHVAELSLYVLVIPLAATIVLVGRARTLDAPLQAFLAATVALTVCVVPIVAVFASEFSARIEERNMFYVAPLFCIALLAWVERGAPRPRLLATVAAVVSALLVVAIPFDRFLTTSAITDTLMLLPLWSLQDRIGESWVPIVALAFAAVLAAAFLFVPGRYALALPLLVLGLWILAIRPIWCGTHGFERFSRGALFQGIRTVDRDWVDQTLPSGARAAFLWTGRTDRLTVNQNEFFNRAVGPVYYVTDPTPGGLPETRVRVDPRTGRVTLPDGSPVRDGTCSRTRRSSPTARRSPGQGLGRHALARAATARLRGAHRRSLSERHVVRTDGHVHATAVHAGAPLGRTLERPEPLHLAADGRRALERTRHRTCAAEPEGKALLSVPVRPAPGTTDCRVVYTVTPTAVPAEVTAGGNPDPRELGAHFNRFVYRPRR